MAIMYTYTYTCISLSLSLSLYIYIHTYIYPYMYSIFQQDIHPHHPLFHPAISTTFGLQGFNAGAAISAVLAGHWLVDRHGRRPALKVGTMLFAAGGALQASSVNQWHLGFLRGFAPKSRSGFVQPGYYTHLVTSNKGSGITRELRPHQRESWWFIRGPWNLPEKGPYVFKGFSTENIFLK